MLSPNLSNVAVFGCLLVYLSVILLGFDKIQTNFKLSNFTHLCATRVYLLSSGLSLAFGSIFAKAYRVHKLFNNSGANVIKNKLLKDVHLITLIFVPAVIDGIIMGLWIVIDPMELQHYNLTLEVSLIHRNVVYQPQISICKSNNTSGWFIALYGYKGLALIMGVFMAWENRHLKIPALQDSQYIGISVYSSTFTAIIVVACCFISNYVIFSYLATAFSILLSTTLTLVLLFLPKLKIIFGPVTNSDSVMKSLGLKVECNTRRFIDQDQKERIYRLEIQNRVFKRELRILDKEIEQLEQRLLQSSKLSLHSSKQSTDALHEIYTVSKNDCHLLRIPETSFGRASWPTSRGQLINPINKFTSENELNRENFFDRFNIFTRIKKFFGSLSSVSRDLSFPENIDANKENPIQFDREHVRFADLKNLQQSKSEVAVHKLS